MSIQNDINFYQELEIDPSLNSSELKKVLTDIRRKWNNRVNSPNKEIQYEAQNKIDIVEQAWTILLDDSQRAEYDRLLSLRNNYRRLNDINKKPTYQYSRTEEERERERKRIETEHKRIEEERRRQKMEEELKRREEERKRQKKQKHIDKDNIFKIVTSIISICLVVIPWIIDPSLLFLIIWVLPVLIFGTVAGFGSDVIDVKEKIGVVILQIVMPLCAYIGVMVVGDVDGIGDSLLLLAIIYGGGFLSFIVGISLADF